MSFQKKVLCFMSVLAWIQSANCDSSVVTNIKTCDFDNRNYFLVNGATVRSLKWGSKPAILKFKDEDEFRKFLSVVDGALDSLVGSSTFNTIDSYIQMHDHYYAYQNQGTVCPRGNFETFFEQYQYEYQPNQNSVSMSIGILDRLREQQKEYRGILRAGYLGNAKFRVWKQFRTVNHVVALYKISVDGVIGYIVLDPGMGAETAAVVMEDSNSPLNRLSTKSASSIFQYKMSSSKDFIDCKTLRFSTNTITDSNYSTSGDNSFNIFVAKGYCSFMDTSEKFNLLDNFKIIRRRLPNKSFVGVALGTRSPQATRSFCFFTLSLDGMQTINCFYYQTLSDKKSSKNMQRLLAFEKTLGFQENVLLNKLKRVQEIIKDGSFSDEVEKLDESLNFERKN